jgi:hypothetical protein
LIIANFNKPGLILLNSEGGYFTSTNDFATIGKGIMNYSLLAKSVTERWLKSVSFQAETIAAVGAPWEITRWETPHLTYDIYAKDGGLAMYGPLFILVPDLNFGVSFLGINAAEPALTDPIKYALSDLALAHFLPVVEDIAREQAAIKFAGTYRGDANSSIVIETDNQPGMRITQWVSNGTDILSLLGGGGPGVRTDARLWPNELYGEQDCQVGFTANFATLPRTAIVMPVNTCFTWGDLDDPTYGNIGFGYVVFGLDASSGEATSIRLQALRATWKRVQ